MRVSPGLVAIVPHVLVALRDLATRMLEPREGRLLCRCSDGTLVGVAEPRLLDQCPPEIGS